MILLVTEQRTTDLNPSASRHFTYSALVVFTDRDR
jgi:hypothetical protein